MDEIIQEKHANMRTKVYGLFVVVQTTNSFAVRLTIIIMVGLVTEVSETRAGEKIFTNVFVQQ